MGRLLQRFLQLPGYARDDGDLTKGAARPDPRFKYNGDGTVTDRLTGLMWEKVPSRKKVKWSDALAYAAGLSLGGYRDWRVPNVAELPTLVNFGEFHKCVYLNNQGFEGVQPDISTKGTKDVQWQQPLTDNSTWAVRGGE